MSINLYFLPQLIIRSGRLPTLLQLASVYTATIYQSFCATPDCLCSPHSALSISRTRVPPTAQRSPTLLSNLSLYCLMGGAHTNTHRAMLISIKTNTCCYYLWSSVAIKLNHISWFDHGFCPNFNCSITTVRKSAYYVLDTGMWWKMNGQSLPIRRPQLHMYLRC